MYDLPTVPIATWEAAIAELRAEEKELTRRHDALAARRRRLPAVEVDPGHRLVGPNGPASLLDLFEGRDQLLVYHFMLVGESGHVCEGCAMFVDQLPHLAHLHARRTSLAVVSRAPIERLEKVRERMGWTVPWYSSDGSDFNREMGVTTDAGESFALSVFLRDGERVLRTYVTAGRGVEDLGSVWKLLDLTPLGRQETWEDTPDGRPQDPPYAWWRRHDAYAGAGTEVAS